MRRWGRWATLCGGLLLAACAAPPPPPLLPEIASGWQAKPGWSFERQAVAAAHPLAAEAGLQMLREGGTAVDAAVAVQMLLGLVEPQSSGIGGGAFLLLWDGQRISAWDGRETAPAAADENLFLLPDGRPMPFMQAVVGGRAVGVPGAVRLLEAVHRQHGRLPWARLLQPAIELAEQGFEVGPRLQRLLTEAAPRLRADGQAAAYFYGPDGQPPAVGARLRNPAYAAVLRQIAAQGADALHTGPVAEDIVRRVRGHAGNPGRLQLADLAGYRPLQREALCAPWRPTARQEWRLCGMPPPSSGQLTLMQILGLLGAAPGSGPALQGGVPGADFLHRHAEASRLAYADRERWIADPGFVPAPGGRWSQLIEPAYLQRRATLIGPQRRSGVRAGDPGGAPAEAGAAQAPQPEHGTSHLSIVDAQGRAVAMTTSIEFAFGAHLMSDGGSGLAGGFLLNNQLTDFALRPRDAAGRPVANRLQPGKRPRSSMSPTLGFDDQGRLQLVLGSPGGAAIIQFTAKALLGMLAWELTPQQALDLPNVVAGLGPDGGPLLLEQGRFDAATVAALQARGHSVQQLELASGLQALQQRGGRWLGGADARREGVVRGD
ncbi:MAG: gamma-glutamyltransferase family protein [Burkholderiaceae bacterium]|nr:gamma-glutamyltransferase family protein [Burkholderiaceae bacterium]